MKLIVELSILSATIATALLVWPTSSSPIINPLVVVDSVTIEDRSITDPRERERLYWQSDHLRLFGRDYGDKLTAAGFKVTESNFINEIDPKLVERYALDKNEIVYYCQKD